MQAAAERGDDEQFDELDSLRSVLGRLVGDLDPDSVPLPCVDALSAAYAEVERLAAAGVTLLARRVAESGQWRREGFASAEEQLAARSGETVAGSRQRLAASRVLPSLPATASALRAGELSVAQTGVVADAANSDASAESSLLATARAEPLSGLRTQAARVRAAAAADPDEAHRRIHRSRSLRTFCDREGAWNLIARGGAEDGSRIMAALGPLVDQAFRQARRAGTHESHAAYAFDALVALARGASKCRNERALASERTGADEAGPATPARVRPTHLGLLRVDLEALRRGAVADEEHCEITGVGPVPVRVAREMLGESILKLVITRGSDVASVIHLGRGPTAAQRVALLWSSPGCSASGCPRTRTEIDHRIPWAQSRHTRLAELDPLCAHHHARKTRDNWALVAGTGRRAMVPPDDPRHPAHAGSRTGTDRAPPALRANG